MPPEVDYVERLPELQRYAERYRHGGHKHNPIASAIVLQPQIPIARAGAPSWKAMLKLPPYMERKLRAWCAAKNMIVLKIGITVQPMRDRCALAGNVVQHPKRKKRSYLDLQRDHKCEILTLVELVADEQCDELKSWLLQMPGQFFADR
jgi:hypothetical protein